MAEVITFEGYRPPPRYDSLPWVEADIYEAATATAAGAVIDTIALSPIDPDPADPAYRDFTTENGTADALWYWVVFKDGTGDEAQPTARIQNVAIAYATTDELFRILKIRNPSDEQRAAGARVLASAAGEINAEIDLASTVSLEGWELSLVAEVNLERAVEHWRQQEAPFGLIGLGAEFGGGAERTARDSWDRHAHKLAPLKNQWGIA